MTAFIILAALPVAHLFLAAGIMPAEGQNRPTVETTIREIVSAVDHNHCTTRQFQHMTFFHEGVWFVFYSDGKHFLYQTSADGGKTWQPADYPIDQALKGSTFTTFSRSVIRFTSVTPFTLWDGTT